MTQKVFVIAAVVITLVLLLLLLAWKFQERIAFQPPRSAWGDAARASNGTARVEYSTSDGEQLFAYLIGDFSAPNGLLLCFHGNADLAVWQIKWAREVFVRTGLTVMLAEYRGYMGLSGRPNYAGSQLDSEAAYLYARNKIGVAPGRIALYGHSMGSAIATELAARHPPAALLLEAPFTSAHAMAARMTGFHPPDFLWRLGSRLHYDTVGKMALIEAPVSVAHGSRDRLIPIEMGRQVYASAMHQGAWLEVPAATHSDVPILGGENYWEWMIEAVKPVTGQVTR
jgi:fermentation-respiration switch protein FrsA (DUF1100 family)